LCIRGYYDKEEGPCDGKRSVKRRWRRDWTLEVIALAEERLGDREIERLVGVPGVGPVVSPAYTAYIGDGSRFGNAAQVPDCSPRNYLGLVPRVDISGTLVRYGGIMKQGNYLRALLVEAARALTRSKKEGR
jgi:transposase